MLEVDESPSEVSSSIDQHQEKQQNKKRSHEEQLKEEEDDDDTKGLNSRFKDILNQALKEPSGPEYRDILPYLDVIAEELELGEMVHGPNFSLAEAMSALEIMDPKMDSGMDSSSVLTLDERIEQTKIPLDSSLSVQQIIGIMDQLLAREAAWYGGHSLAQTVFTCLYMHRTTILENRYLEIFCKALFKSVGTIRSLVLRADIYEEEDFVPLNFGFDLEGGPETEQLIKIINSIEEDLAAKVRHAKGKKAKGDAENVLPLQSDPTKEVEVCEALLARIRFRRGMLTLHLNFEKVSKSFESSRKATIFTQSQLPLIKKSLSFAVQVPEIFEPLIIKRLAATSPPRFIEIPTPEQAIDFFDKHLNELLVICNISECTTLKQLQDFFFLFSKRKPNVVSRSRLRLLFKEFPAEFYNKVKVDDLVSESMLSFSVFEAPWLKTHQALDLVEKSSKIVLQLFHVLCKNRARQRRALAHTFENWAVLQQEADQLDALIDEKRTESRFTIWVADQTIQVMNHFQFLGIEIELFEDHELPAVYWYLDYTLGRYVHNQADAAMISKLRSQKASARKGRKPSGRKEGKSEAPPMTPIQLVAEAQQALSRGVMRLMFGLIRDNNRYQLPELTFGSPDIRFFHRFWPFVRLQNPLPLNHQLFEQYTNYSNHTPSTIYQSALDCFKLAQNCLERLISTPASVPQSYTVPELRSIAKVALGNSVQTQLLLRLSEPPKPSSPSSATGSSSTNTTRRPRPTFDFSVHEHFPVIKVPLK